MIAPARRPVPAPTPALPAHLRVQAHFPVGVPNVDYLVTHDFDFGGDVATATPTAIHTQAWDGAGTLVEDSWSHFQVDAGERAAIQGVRDALIASGVTGMPTHEPDGTDAPALTLRLAFDSAAKPVGAMPYVDLGIVRLPPQIEAIGTAMQQYYRTAQPAPGA